MNSLLNIIYRFNRIKVRFLLKTSLTNLSGDHLPTMQALSKKADKASSSLSVDENSGSFDNLSTSCFRSLVNGI